MKNNVLFKIAVIVFVALNALYCDKALREPGSIDQSWVYSNSWSFDNEKGGSLPFIISFVKEDDSHFKYSFDLVDFGYVASGAYLECSIEMKCLVIHSYKNIQYIDASLQLVDKDTLKVIYLSLQGAGNLYSEYSSGNIPPKEKINCEGCILKRKKIE